MNLLVVMKKEQAKNMAYEYFSYPLVRNTEM
jgi:hypothetical protein